MRVLGYLACLLLVACSGLTRAERVRYGIDTARAACVLYSEDQSIPREAEADEVCLVLAGGPE